MPLGNKRRVLVLMALTAGILTFFAPLVTVDPVVSSDAPAKLGDPVVGIQNAQGRIRSSIPNRR